MVGRRCRGRLAYECMGRVRVFRIRDGRRVYRFRCTSCGRGGENTGRRRVCAEVTLLHEVAT